MSSPSAREIPRRCFPTGRDGGGVGFCVPRCAQARADGRGVSPRGLGAGWRSGLGVYGMVETLAVVRWQLLLRIQGFRLGWKRATGILFIGEFFSDVHARTGGR